MTVERMGPAFRTSLALWRWAALLAVAIRWRRRRYVVARELLVATEWAEAADHVRAILKHLSTRRVFRVQSFRSLDRPASESDPARRIAGVWSVEVPWGLETPVLRELEYRLARALEWTGGYAGVERRLSLLAARSAVSAHPARRVVPARPAAAWAPKPVIFQLSEPVEFRRDIHDAYKRMLGVRGGEPARRVRIAVMDTAINLDHVPETVRSRIHVQEIERNKRLRPCAHAAVMTSILADIDPSADVTVFPVTGRERMSETVLTEALYRTDADVVSMSLAMDGGSYVTNPDTVRSSMERALASLPPATIVVVASGNASGSKLAARFPATCSTVLMIGATDRHARRARYSCHELDDRRPRLYLVAPGGDRRSDDFSAVAGKTPFDGTSVAAAYAAGVVARVIGISREETIRADDVLAALKAGSRHDFDGFALSRPEYGDGLIQQVEVARPPGDQVQRRGV